MLNQLRQRSNDEGGFTLIELLVVVLIIGILAAIAIPSFLNQKGKAQDSAAKSQVTTLQTAMETYATDHNGTYKGANLAELEAIEPTLKDTSTATPLVVSAEATAGKPEYEVTSTAVSGNVFKLKNVEGTITRACTTAGKGGCHTGGTW
jgi:type IV pilus assembly protein PilA